MEKHVLKIRATLDEGPRSRDQLIQVILLVPRPFHEGPRPKIGKLRLIWHLFWREINWLGPKDSAKRRAPDLENQESG
jgi:hypothetical protein